MYEEMKITGNICNCISLTGDWGIKAADEAAIVQEDKEFQTQLKAIAKIFTNNQSTFSTSLRDFLMALSLVRCN